MTKTKGFLYLTFVFGIALHSARTEELSYQGLTLAINDFKGGTKISLQRQKAKAAVLVQRIEAPTRFVIDVPGHKIGGNKTFTIADSRLISAARFGVHPDKTRIVLDVLPELTEIPSLKVSGESSIKTLLVIGNELPAKTNSAKVAATPIELKRITKESIVVEPPPAQAIPSITPTAADQEMQAEPEPKPLETQKSIPVMEEPATPEPTAVPTAEPTLEAVRQATATPTASPTPRSAATPKSTPSTAKVAAPSERRSKPATGKILSEINFAYLGDQQSPVLKIALGERTEFRLAKTDTKFYTITVPGFGVAGKHLLLPFFPPKDFVGFSVVVAKETSAGIEISIGVDPGVRLMAFADGNSILVKVP